MSLLEIDSVNFRYGQNKILSDIYLKVKEGEVVGFLGRNGCGKSTLLKIIFGSLRGDGQSVRIDGEFVSQPFKASKVKFLPQDTMMPGYMTPLEVASMLCSETIQLSRYEEYYNHERMKLSELSSGIRKFVETLIILYSPAKFILLDEPFSFIAPVLVEKLIPIIREVTATKGILLTDHQYRSILEVSDRLYLMRDQGIYPIQGEGELKGLGYIS